MEEIYKIYYTLIKELNLTPEQVNIMPVWQAQQLYDEVCKSKK